MIATDFEGLLKQAMGLDAQSIGSVVVARAVQERQAACRIEDIQRYWQFALTSAVELQQLIETVVVPETWFFRDREAFSALVQVALGKDAAAREDLPLRLLSLPCSTGEEPYSMAIALLDAGVSPERFSIDAIDISTRALALAQQAEYGNNSFRGAASALCGHHFESGKLGMRLSETVRRQVQFRQGNLFDPNLFAAGEAYDAIFCRNVLIYFDGPGKELALRQLTRWLAPQGMLFVGPSESGLLLQHGFVSTKVPLAFAFRKAAATGRKPEGPPPRRTMRTRRAAPVGPAAVAMPPPAPQAPPMPATHANTLDTAEQLADQGRLDEALDACLQQIREQGPSARAFHLLGLLHGAGGQAGKAAACYRKALYLDPQHSQALIHLALLLEKQGDLSGARRLRERRQRLQAREQT